MVQLISWRELQDKAVDTGIDLRNYMGRQFLSKACELREKYPNLFRQPILRTEFMRHMCSYFEDAPNFPTPPFSGGNCPIEYKAEGYFIEANEKRGCDNIGLWTLGISTVLGPIEGISMLPGTNGGVKGALTLPVPLINGGGTGTSSGTTKAVSVSSSPCNQNTPEDTPLAMYQNRFITSVTPADGSEDICGDALPPPPDPPINQYDFQFQFDYTYVDVGGNTINFNPVVKVDFNPEFDFRFEFDVAGDKFYFDYDGVNYSPPGGGGGGGGGGGVPEVLPPPQANPDLDETVRDPTDPKEEAGVDKLAYVGITILSKAKNIKNQWGGDTAPDIYYLGWIEFRAGAAYYPRIPIHFLQNIFVAPPGADGYAYTLYQGVTGFATVYTVNDVV